MEDQQERKKIQVFYYPQCPWIIPTIMNIEDIAKELNLDYQKTSSSDQRFFLVKVDGKRLPIGIGTLDKEYTKKVKANSPLSTCCLLFQLH